MESASETPKSFSSNVSNAKTTGAIRKLKDGYGFIAGDDGRDYFFHWSAMERTGKNFRDLLLQERVEFYIVKFAKGGEDRYRAVQIRVIG
jgi:cold shock CspA family protein